MANATTESEFSVEAVWHRAPMGYHLGWGGDRLPDGVWANQEQRRRIYEYW